MLCRGRHEITERQNCLCVALLGVRMTDHFIDVAQRIDSSRSIADGLAVLTGHYKNYPEAYIFEEDGKKQRERIRGLMLKPKPSKAQCEQIIGFWHDITKRALWLSSRGVPRPVFKTIPGKEEV